MQGRRLLFLYVRKVFTHTKNPWRAARFFLRALVAYRVSIEWLSFIETHPVLSTAPDEVKRILGDKIHRPFARNGLGTAQRAALLQDHYTFLSAQVKPEALADLVADKPLVLGEVRGKNESGPFVLTLGRNMLSQHQGELTILFHDPSIPYPAARLMFNFSRDENSSVMLVITGIQGPGAAFKSGIVRATRNLSGLRPKRAVFEAASAIARASGAHGIIATSKKNHVSQSRKKWKRKVVADYDDFWRELSPVILKTGDYLFPPTLPRRSADDVAPKKRKDWERRYTLLDDLAARTKEAFSSIRKIPSEQ